MSAFLLHTCVGPVVVCSIPKCGQHTLNSVSSCMVGDNRLTDYSIRLAFIRDPLDRIRSCFHFYLDKNYRVDGYKVKSYEHFVDLALDSDDEHIRPQKTFINSLYNTFIPLEKMSHCLEGLTGKKTPILNTSGRFDVDDSYRFDDIKLRYNDDFSIYKKAKKWHM